MNKVKIHFLGASGTVTGSKYYLEASGQNIMVDCGVFQGLKALRALNWNALPIHVSQVHVVLLTHGHLDHTGYLPRLVRAGFKGKILGTGPTLAIAAIILLDSAKIHEEEAKMANEEGYSKHHPALPFYTREEAEKAIALFEPVEVNHWLTLSEHISCKFNSVGHILGATFIELNIYGKHFVFSGDVGRTADVLLEDPKKPQWADYLFLESTYGNKLHPKEPVDAMLKDLVLKTVNSRGVLIIPSFAVERLQTIMYTLWKLQQNNRIPNISVFVDSPMGNNVLSVFEQFPAWHKLKPIQYKAMLNHFNIITSYKQTWETIDDPRPKIIIAGSGMITGGRVLTYLKQFLSQSSTTVLLIGYQAEGTRGRQLLEGAYEIKLFGKYVPVKASIVHFEGLSAHADQAGLLDWVSEIKNFPEKVFLVHGEPTALDALRVKLRDRLGWNASIPSYGEVVDIVL